VLERDATPPVIEKEKSLTSNAPLPPVALYTASENVKATVLLSEANEIDKTTGTITSYKSAILLLCEVLAPLPEAS